MTLNKIDVAELNEIEFHDFPIYKLILDYSNGEIEFYFVETFFNTNNINYRRLLFTGVTDLTMSQVEMTEMWDIGYNNAKAYIANSKNVFQAYCITGFGSPGFSILFSFSECFTSINEWNDSENATPPPL